VRLVVALLVVVSILILFHLPELTAQASSAGSSPQAARSMGTPGLKLNPGTPGQ
jgi:competence protein ComGC